MVYNVKLLDSGETELEVQQRMILLQEFFGSLSIPFSLVFSQPCEDDIVMRELHDEHDDDKRCAKRHFLFSSFLTKPPMTHPYGFYRGVPPTSKKSTAMRFADFV